MKIDFTGKKAIVCGGSRGIGKAIALGIAKAGGDVSICARDVATLEKTKAEIASHGHKVHVASVDLAKGDAVRAYVKDAVAALGGLDVLVNNASAFGNTDDDHGWTSSLQIDMLAIVHATQEALPALQKTKGSVVNISSISAHHPAARQPPYGAIKAAVIHYTVTQAAMYAKDKVRVNCIAPGPFLTDVSTVWRENKAYELSLGLKRFGAPHEIVGAALFLASDASSYVTGQVIRVDGGTW